MNDQKARWAFIIFHVTLAAMILLESVRTLMHVISPQEGATLNLHLVLLSSTEAVAAILLLIPKTMRIGGGLLLIIFGIALATHGISHEMFLFVYSAGVILIIVHGSAFRKK